MQIIRRQFQIQSSDFCGLVYKIRFCKITLHFPHLKSLFLLEIMYHITASCVD